MTALHLSASSAQHVAAYLEYRNVVGDDDRGRLFTEREYEEYKRDVASARLTHRLYVSWRATGTGMDCRQVGPSSLCFCQHRYRQHATDNFEDRHVHCKVPDCPCPLFEYVPIRGAQDVRCSACKHSIAAHDPRTRRCHHSSNGSTLSTAVARHTAPRRRLPAALSPVGVNQAVSSADRRSLTTSAASSCSCDGFTTSNSCSCTAPWSAHRTVFESREERETDGRPVDRHGGTIYAAMGGLTGFTSLVDGVDLARVRGAESSVIGRGQTGRSSLLSGDTAAMAIVAGDEVKERQLRHGKVSESDEMALYDAKYHSSMVGSAVPHTRPSVITPPLR